MNFKQQFSPCNQSNEVNSDLLKSLREQIENLKAKHVFYAKKWKKKILY